MEERERHNVFFWREIMSHKYELIQPVFNMQKHTFSDMQWHTTPTKTSQRQSQRRSKTKGSFIFIILLILSSVRQVSLCVKADNCTLIWNAQKHPKCFLAVPAVWLYMDKNVKKKNKKTNSFLVPMMPCMNYGTTSRMSCHWAGTAVFYSNTNNPQILLLKAI